MSATSAQSIFRRFLVISPGFPHALSKHARCLARRVEQITGMQSQQEDDPMADTSVATFEPAEDSAFVAFWNEVLAPKFIRFKHVLVGGLTHHSEAIFPTLPVRQGDRVLDVGCGFGDTAIKFAALVGPSGKVTGIDCCDAFLDHARQDAAARQVMNVQFVRGDAEIALPKNAYDFVFARFGTMFFANPVAGLRNMRKALKPGGRMVHIVWRNRKDNPWLSMARDVVLEFLPPPGADAQTCGPGPFSMADEETVRAMMHSAGPMASWKAMASATFRPTSTGASTRRKSMSQ
jgi:ubiquinone/menaquinone biosynthesis C-methylase UbiE